MNYNEKISRKSFMKASAFMLAAPMLSKLDLTAKASSKIGLQLYTLRTDLAKDLEGTLKKVAAIGYKEVELFGYNDGKFFGKTPKEFKAILDGLGLNPVSGHYGAGVQMKDQKGTLSNDWQRAVDDAAAIGQKYVNCAYLTDGERKSIEDYKKYVDLFNKSGEVAKKAGLQFGYHNHDFEFKKMDGQLPYDLIASTDPDLVKLELDLYWIVKAGLDPVDLFKKYPGRFPLWHVKDMDKTDQSFAEVGTGSIDFKKIFDARKIAGLQHFFVEQDVAKRPALEAIDISFKNVTKMKV
ncbi:MULTISPECIES: sugar phosphate isomerase/epimerase family protein [Dyadobacter]|uniref:Sugar phosphate isomerase/epimerase n=1 Tax=Dyadobacter chenhuakuii TaxID=2909339 RepID=A0A9X1QAA0_9BACT|nr:MULTISPECIES: sugar phosphate isomerase/epimerase [Dyadobacter]MCF2492215.1 sugar phosphate isomerase/epimerase [Dyadobacter chenhuakuii]MCF2497354.1 sugar phosphate isomerase/epimerase [Dyadobacter chenhuakuii]USJ33477.1 sugar phosphate isomerase/epimerase [Dyadobacter chenhuakuii]